MIKIGIECESIEGETWGVGRIVSKLLEEISLRPKLIKEFRFYLYFKSEIPSYSFLDNPIFIKKVSYPSFLPSSFSFYYYVFLPIRLWFEKLDMMYFPKNMLPIIFLGKSAVTLTEDLYYEMTKGNLPFRYRLAYKIFSNWASLIATRIVAVSQASKSAVAAAFKIDPDRIFVVPNAVEPVKSLAPRVRSEAFNAGDYIFYLGQAFPRRHLKETIAAFELLASEFPKLRLIAVGKDAYWPLIIKELVKETNTRLGWQGVIYKEYVSQDELNDLYFNAKTQIYVSTIEAFGLPPLEALAHGVPAIVADMPATREIFGDNAFFVKDPGSIAEIIEAMKKSLRDSEKRQEILKNAEPILSRYTWSHHTDKFLELAREVAAL